MIIITPRQQEHSKRCVAKKENIMRKMKVQIRKLNLNTYIIFIQKMARLELPDDVLVIINEYARPLTRPDWRTLHKMPYYNYKQECYSKYFKNSRHKVFNANNLARIFIYN